MATATSLSVSIQSFGFKYGLPIDSDLVTDVRFLPNPHWIPELREQNGTDAPVRDYVLSQEGAGRIRPPLRRHHPTRRRRLSARGQSAT